MSNWVCKVTCRCSVLQLQSIFQSVSVGFSCQAISGSNFCVEPAQRGENLSPSVRLPPVASRLPFFPYLALLRRADLHCQSQPGKTTVYYAFLINQHFLVFWMKLQVQRLTSCKTRAPANFFTVGAARGDPRFDKAMPAGYNPTQIHHLLGLPD